MRSVNTENHFGKMENQFSRNEKSVLLKWKIRSVKLENPLTKIGKIFFVKLKNALGKINNPLLKNGKSAR
jgi:hypothetical protein